MAQDRSELSQLVSVTLVCMCVRTCVCVCVCVCLEEPVLEDIPKHVSGTLLNHDFTSSSKDYSNHTLGCGADNVVGLSQS